MEKQLNCFLLLPLKEMVLRRMAMFFLIDSDISAYIFKFPYRFHFFITEGMRKEWRENIEDKIKHKILKLEIPKLLAKQMIDLVKPIGLEIIRWKRFHQDFLDKGSFQSSEEINIPDSTKLCWTAAGRIDNKKIAEELVLCNGLDVRDRYELACLYCLEDHIPRLWKELPEEQKEYFCVEGELRPDLHFCWPHVFKGELFKLNHLLRRDLTSFNQWAFEDSVKRGNKSAAEYFFNKLTHEEKEASLMRSAHALLSNSEEVCNLAERFSDVLCYLLSLMRPEQQKETIKVHPVNVLLSFLYWPWQDLFLDNASLIWPYIPPSSYDDLHQRMFDIFRSYWPKSFPEFFSQCPLRFKKYFVEFKDGFIPACRYLSIFFRSEDSESVEFMFRNVDAADRVRLVFHPDVLDLFYKSMWRDRWRMVEVCLREATLSDADKKGLKENFMGLLGIAEDINRHFKRFFEFLDETDAIADEEKTAQDRKF